MVVEDDDGIVGYVVAALNIKTYNRKMAVSWIPELQAKYPLEEVTNDVSSSVQVRISLIPLSVLYFQSYDY